MKTPKQSIALFGAVIAFASGHVCSAQSVIWEPLTSQMEFGATAVVGGTQIESPSAIESGYNGALFFGASTVNGLAQTFTVPSSRLLQSIQLRVGQFNNQVPTGQFELAIYTFDSLSGAPGSSLASVLANAQDFQFSIFDVPVSSFDFTKLNVWLNPAQTYALVVTPTVTFTGMLALQSGSDIYAGGTAYSFSIVPEPSMVSLCGLGAALYLVLTFKAGKR